MPQEQVPASPRGLREPALEGSFWTGEEEGEIIRYACEAECER